MSNKEGLEIDIVVFREANAVIAGVQQSPYKSGWKNSTAKLAMGGVLFEVPGYRPTLIPMSKIERIEFKM